MSSGYGLHGPGRCFPIWVSRKRGSVLAGECLSDLVRRSATLRRAWSSTADPRASPPSAGSCARTISSVCITARKRTAFATSTTLPAFRSSRPRGRRARLTRIRVVKDVLFFQARLMGPLVAVACCLVLCLATPGTPRLSCPLASGQSRMLPVRELLRWQCEGLCAQG